MKKNMPFAIILAAGLIIFGQPSKSYAAAHSQQAQRWANAQCLKEMIEESMRDAHRVMAYDPQLEFITKATLMGICDRIGQQVEAEILTVLQLYEKDPARHKRPWVQEKREISGWFKSLCFSRWQEFRDEDGLISAAEMLLRAYYNFFGKMHLECKEPSVSSGWEYEEDPTDETRINHRDIARLQGALQDSEGSNTNHQFINQWLEECSTAGAPVSLE